MSKATEKAYERCAELNENPDTPETFSRVGSAGAFRAPEGARHARKRTPCGEGGQALRPRKGRRKIACGNFTSGMKQWMFGIESLSQENLHHLAPCQAHHHEGNTHEPQ
mgnify:CR=1 FL=1